MSDAAIGGRRVRILLRIRRLFCVNPGCRARTFAEQVDGLTSRRARRTPPLARALASIALALAGRAGARLAGALDLTASRSSMLRLVMALPDPETGALAIVGIDDFAFRRGRDYGTIVINVETGRPVDLLRDREAATVADWLKEHPGIKVICRDRAGAYADGARQGAPDADQVADRWHIYHNLCEHVGRAAARHRSCLEEPAPEEPEQPAAPDARQAPDLQQAAIDAAARRVEESALAVRTRQRYDLVQSLKAQGKGIKPIKRETGLAKETVRRFYYAETVGELLVKVKDGRPSILDEHKPYLHQRWNDGVTNVIQLHAELKERGYKGSYGTVRDYVLPFREAGAAPPAVPGRPRPVTWPGGSPPTRTTSMTTRKPSSRRPQSAARTWMPSPGTSPSSPRSSPAATATASMTGSPRSRPTTSLTCTPSSAASSATTTPCSTASPCPGAQASSRATSTGPFCGIRIVKSRPVRSAAWPAGHR